MLAVGILASSAALTVAALAVTVLIDGTLTPSAVGIGKEPAPVEAVGAIGLTGAICRELAASLSLGNALPLGNESAVAEPFAVASSADVAGSGVKKST